MGVSTVSMVMTPPVGSYFVKWRSAADDRTLGVVDFSIVPHVDVFPEGHRLQALGRGRARNHRLPVDVEAAAALVNGPHLSTSYP